MSDEQTIEVMVEGETLKGIEFIPVPRGHTAREIVVAVAEKGGFPAEEAILLVEDCGEPLDLAIVVTDDMARKKHHVHRVREIAVVVFYKNLEKEKRFPPSARVQCVLDWAVGKDGFNLDPILAPEMELARHDKIPDAHELPKTAHIGRYVQHEGHHHHHRLALDLIRGVLPQGANDDSRWTC
jgi:hypothetical protein